MLNNASGYVLIERDISKNYKIESESYWDIYMCQQQLYYPFPNRTNYNKENEIIK